MRKKTVLITAMLAVMVAMTGIVAAMDAAIVDSAGNPAPVNISLVQGDQIDLNFRTANFVPGIYPVNVTIVPLNGGNAGNWQVIISATDNMVTNPTLLLFTVKNNGALPGELVRVTITAGQLTAGADFGAASRNFNSIPEFPAVALPVAAVIGLVFFFQQKKKKE